MKFSRCRHYYVYIQVDSFGKIFYVGKGSTSRYSRNQFSSRSKLWLWKYVN